MTLDHLLILSAIQGVTEFLPVSSSAHLILLPHLTGWPDQGRAMDVAVHAGTLLAVLIYYHRDVAAMTRGGLRLGIGRFNPDSRLLLNVIIATLPLIAAGFAVHLYLPEGFFRDPRIIGWASIGFGVLLYVADRSSLVIKRVEHMRCGDALLIGIVQIIALIPGASRAGMTMTAARMLGYERREAARFSMLLSIPAILGAGSLIARDFYRAGDWVATHDASIAAGLSFITALVAIAAMLAWLRRASFTPFVIYRIILGAALLWFFDV